ncbi:MAG: signal peptidase I [Clostridia bacterium]|nr:signal peptidase I [Clostridia bacterium]
MAKKRGKILSVNLSVESLQKELNRVEKKILFCKKIRNTIFSLIVIAAITVIISVMLFPVLRVFGTSMKPTLCEGDLLISLKTEKIRTGELVAFYYGNKVLIKRCIATAGDTVSIDESGAVTVNGEEINEPYVSEKAFGECDLEMPYYVPENRYFVMGDQRKDSIDSRSTKIGCVAPEQIIGKVVLRIWPINKICFFNGL